MDSYYKSYTKRHKITLHNDNRVLQITDEGLLQMVVDNGHNATQIELQESINPDCMRRSLSLYYNNTKITFNTPHKNEDVQIYISSNDCSNDYSYCSPYIIEKKINNIAILNNSFASFALDDYNRNENLPGPIKWWHLNTTINGLKTPKPNQLFTIKYLSN
tara:strand:- start:38 stop:520 length:483 start_codon:yes stop_codon:yes gene_type:complete